MLLQSTTEMKQPKWSDEVIGRMERYEKVAFASLTLLLLWPIWANKYFLTLDGPCHLYNASVLLDLWKGHHTDFFSQFYRINHQIDPNWFSHIVLAGLMQFLSPLMSEKIVQTVYIAGYLFFSRWLIIYISRGNKLLVFVPFLFAYHYVFQMGFYNFSYSLIWMMLTWYVFLKYQNRWPKYLFIPICAFLFLLCYSSHAVGYITACLSLILLLLIESIEELRLKGKTLRQISGKWIVLSAAMLPSLLLLVYFILRKSSEPFIPCTRTFASLGDDLIHLTAISTLVSAEAPFAKAAFFFIAGITAIGLLTKIWGRRFSRYDAFLLISALLVIVYFNSPRSIAGAGVIYERYQIMPFVVLPFWLASVAFPRWWSAIIGIGSVMLIVCLMAIRIPVYRLSSQTVAEYLSAAKYIKPSSTVVPLCYAQAGKTPDGKTIADRNWIFLHATDYMGADKPLVIMDNYEGNTGYFPLVWRDEVNPFYHLGGDAGIEQIPPIVNLMKYEQETHHRIDYVILLHPDGEFSQRPNTLTINKELNEGYTKLYTSQHGLAVLYQRQE